MDRQLMRKYTFTVEQLKNDDGFKDAISACCSSVIGHFKRNHNYFKAIEIDFAVASPESNEVFLTENISESHKQLFALKDGKDSTIWQAKANREVYVFVFCKIK